MYDIGRDRAKTEEYGDFSEYWHSKPKWERGYIVCLVVLVLFLLVLLLTFFCLRDTSCKSPECIEASSIILKYIDPSIDPCNNFHEFVCGTFMKNAFIDDDPSAFRSVAKRFENQMKDLVVQPIEPEDSQPLVMVKRFYESCMDTQSIREDENQSFLDMLRELGEWPLLSDYWEDRLYNWVWFFTRSQKLGIGGESFIKFDKIENPETEENILTVLPAGHFKDISKTKAGIIFRSMQGVITTLKPNIPEDSQQLEWEITETVEFLLYLCEMYDEASVVEKEPTIMTISELEEAQPDIPWVTLIQEGVGINVTGDTSIAYDLDKYINKLVQFLNDSKKRTQANYLFWNIFLEYAPYLDQSLSTQYYEYIAKLAETDEAPPTRYQICLEEVDKRLTHVKEMEYVRRMTDEDVRGEVSDMIENIKSAFEDLILTSDWMDDEVKAKGIEKLQNMAYYIGGSEEMYNETYFDAILGVDDFIFSSNNIIQMVKERNVKMRETFANQLYENTPEDDYTFYFDNVVVLNAFFAPMLNLLVLPAPILQDIFFNIEFPRYMNYGAIGRILAHEIMHGFTKNARAFKMDNQSSIDWWNEDTEAAFDEKVQCVIEEYESFSNEYELDGNLTLNENVADYVSIDAAYMAYQRWIQKNGGEWPLPGLDYTPNQLYWIQANMFLCFQKIDSDNYNLDNENDKHGLPMFRIEAAVRNSKYFADDFYCEYDAPMNPDPEDRCQVL